MITENEATETKTETTTVETIKHFLNNKPSNIEHNCLIIYSVWRNDAAFLYKYNRSKISTSLIYESLNVQFVIFLCLICNLMIA